MKRTLYILFFTLAFLTSCHKEQPNINDFKNCDCVKEVSAEFQMGQKLQDVFFDLDTIHYYPSFEDHGTYWTSQLNGNCYVNFSANIENATSYEWQIGNSSVVYTSKEFGLYFGDTVGTIPITLIVKSKPNKICFPNDDGIDTLTRYLTITVMEKPTFFGTYLGANDYDPTNQFTIKIDTHMYGGLPISSQRYIGYGVKNLPFGNEFAGFYNFNTCSFEGIDNSDNDLIEIMSGAKGYYLKDKNELVIEYQSRVFNSLGQIISTSPKTKFRGKKISQ
jgi:hypothetical protein